MDDALMAELEEGESELTRSGIPVRKLDPSHPSRDCLVLVSGNPEGNVTPTRIFEIVNDHVLGRSEADFSLPITGVSRRHARIYRREAEIYIEDLGSTNGVIVNGLRMDLTPLRDGDRVQIGAALLVKLSLPAEDNGERLAPEGRTWSPTSWRAFPALHQPAYADPSALDAVLERVRLYPPLVAMGEVRELKQRLAEAAEGKRFILQGGDCAERFKDCNSDAVLRRLKILSQMSLVLSYGARRPVTSIGRIAGQYAKPRSKQTETKDGVELPAFFGDNINGHAFDPVAREPDPARIEQSYFLSAATLNFARALLKAGFGDVGASDSWRLDFIPSTPVYAPYRDIASRLADTIAYLHSVGYADTEFRNGEFFSSHEALLLPYEEALTRRSREGGPFYNLGAHLLWLGERTRQIDGAHVEYARGIANPIGVKVGPNCQPDELVALTERLNPTNEAGRLMLITRLGMDNVTDHLPALINAVRRSASPKVLWTCDPMHGNTRVVSGVKTRDFNDIVSELTETFEIHRKEKSHLGGVHFELTGENVTECLGGIVALDIEDLRKHYDTGCDPRLNYAQSMEMAFLLSDLLRSK